MPSKYWVNDDAVAEARQMIDSKQYDIEASWPDAAPSTTGDLLDHLDEVSSD